MVAQKYHVFTKRSVEERSKEADDILVVGDLLMLCDVTCGLFLAGFLLTKG